MDRILIRGGRPLKGSVGLSGSKNAALPVIAAALLADGASTIRGVPRLRDVETMRQILSFLGVRTTWRGRSTLVVDPSGLKRLEAPYDLVRRMRASICVLGPLLGRHRAARVSMPGGCVIGGRPVDLHLKGISALGAEVRVVGGYIEARGKAMRGGEVFLGGRYGSSVLATANVLMAATLCRGETLIGGAACEPEIVDLALFLKKMGSRIDGEGSPLIRVRGVRRLSGAEHRVIPDRIEAGTLMIAAAITGGDVVIRGARPEHLQAVVDKLRACGVRVETAASRVHVRGTRRPGVTDVTTLPYPGFPTDLQAQMMALMAVAGGISVITEKVFPRRFMHVSELNRMAARISLEGPTAVVRGVEGLYGAPVMASDLRASAALILAGLVAKGETVVDRVYHLDRGYEGLEKKLSALGSDIRRVKETDGV